MIDDCIVAAAGIDDVGAAAAIDGIVAGAAGDDVGPARSRNRCARRQRGSIDILEIGDVGRIAAGLVGIGKIDVAAASCSTSVLVPAPPSIETSEW